MSEVLSSDVISEEDLIDVKETLVQVQSKQWCCDVLKTAGRKKYFEAGDVSCKDSLQTLIGMGLIHTIRHATREFNAPDYSITPKGYQVYELLVLSQM